MFVIWEGVSCAFLEGQDQDIPGLQDPAVVPNVQPKPLMT